MKLTGPISNDPEVILEGQLEHLRLYLAHHMRTLRENANLNQSQLAQKLGKKQAAISKLENSLVGHDLESIMRYLSALDAELLVAIKHDDQILQVSDNENHLLVDVPSEIATWAKRSKISPRTYVQGAIEKHRNTVGYSILPMKVTTSFEKQSA